MLRLQNTSIQRKLIIIQVSTAFFAVLLCCSAFVYNDLIVFKENAVRIEHSIAVIIGDNAAPTLEFADPPAANKMLAKLRSNPRILNAVILDDEGKEFARYNRLPRDSFSFNTTEEQERETQQGFGSEFVVSYKIIDKEFLGTVKLRAHLKEFREIVFNYLMIAGLILILSLALALIISSVLQKSITKRLLALVNKTKEVADTDNYSLRVPIDGQDEIATLTTSFNHMLSRIEKMESQLRSANDSLEQRVKARTMQLQSANTELERFAYAASHDLQEPLRTISNYSGLLHSRYSDKLDQAGNKYLDNVLRGASRMRDLVKDILELSRIGKDVKFATIDTNHILKEAIEQLNASIQESNTIITSDTLPVVNGIEVELKQLFQNLISNAIKFRKKDVPSEISITVEEKETEYLFAFKDNGIGIEEQYKDRIFIIFQRLHGKEEYPGTGIGLASCKKIVALHHGKIWVESQLGKGSTFYFTISKKI